MSLFGDLIASTLHSNVCLLGVAVDVEAMMMRKKKLGVEVNPWGMGSGSERARLPQLSGKPPGEEEDAPQCVSMLRCYNITVPAANQQQRCTHNVRSDGLICNQ